jgi:hypothetical protein
MAPFPVPARRTGRAAFPHPALGPGSSRQHAQATGWARQTAQMLGKHLLPRSRPRRSADGRSSRGGFWRRPGILLGLRQSRPLPHRVARTPEPGPLPSGGLSSFPPSSVLRAPPPPACGHEDHVLGWKADPPTAGGLPVLRAHPSRHAVTSAPAERTGPSPVATGPYQPSPSPGRVGLRIVYFGVLRCSLALRPADSQTA